MLYDPKWKNPETKADPLQLSTLIAWLEKQPADKSYRPPDARTCLLGKYFEAMGRQDYVYLSTMLGTLSTKLGRVAGILNNRLWDTYGAALERARALAAQQS